MGSEELLLLGLRAQILIAAGFADAGMDAEAVAEAQRILPGLLTTGLWKADRDVFRQILVVLARHGERSAAEAAFRQFLRENRDYSDPQRCTALMARYLNLWNGTNLAGLGADPEAELSESEIRRLCKRNWREISEQMLAWFDTGKDPAAIPQGYRAGRDDLRIVCFRKGQSETAIVSPWVRLTSATVVGGVRVAQAGDIHLCYSIGKHPTVSPGPGEYVFYHDLELAEAGAGAFQGRTDAFTIDNLPQTVSVADAPDIVIMIERADSPESVLAGTKAFEDWWEKYGPGPNEWGARQYMKGEEQSNRKDGS